MKPEKIVRTHVEQEDGWDYFVDAAGDVSRVPVDDDDDIDVTLVEKVAKAGVQRTKGFYWFVDEEGDVSRGPMNREFVLLASDNLLEERHDCTSYFERTENSYWIITDDSDEADDATLLWPRRMHSWLVQGAPDGWLPGDRIVLWRLGGEPRAVGVGEIFNLDSEGDVDGDHLYNVSWFGPSVEGGPAKETLGADPLFAGAAFLEADEDGAFFPLSHDQGESVGRRLAEAYPELRAHWPDVFGEDPASEVRWQQVPLFDRCMYHLLHTDRLRSLAEAGSGTVEIKGNWASAAKFLEEARAQGRRLAVLFDHAEWFVNPDHIGLLTGIQIEKLTGRKYLTTLTFDRFVELPRKYLFTKLRLAKGGAPVNPRHQRGSLICQTPRLFLENGLPELGAAGSPVDQPDAARSRTPVAEPSASEPTSNPVTAKLSSGAEQTANEGAGFGTADHNREVEQAAVRMVTQIYKRRGWFVESVEQDRCGYDLKCWKAGKEDHVEVKGVSGKAIQFAITAGEIKRARTDEAFVLYVVNEALAERPVIRQWRGSSFEEEFEVEPTQYRARLRD